MTVIKKLFILLYIWPITGIAQLIASPDSIKRETLIINKVFASDNITIHVTVSACFGGEEYSLTLTKTNNGYSFTTKGYVKQNSVGTISKEQLSTIKQLFIKGLSINNSSLCTTNEHFTASANGQEAIFADYRCNDDDYFVKLKKILRQE